MANICGECDVNQLVNKCVLKLADGKKSTKQMLRKTVRLYQSKVNSSLACILGPGN